MLAHVLLVENSDAIAAHAAEVLRGVAFVSRVQDDEEAYALVAQALPDIVLTDLRGVMSGASPVDYVASLRVRLDACASRVRARSPAIVLASGMDPKVLHAIAGALVGVHALPKPYGPRALRELVERLTAPRGGAHPEG